MGEFAMTLMRRIDSDVYLRYYAIPLFWRKGNSNGSDTGRKPSENARYRAIYGTCMNMSNN